MTSWVNVTNAVLFLCLPVSQSSIPFSSLLRFLFDSHLMMQGVPASGLWHAKHASSCSIQSRGEMDSVGSSLLCFLVSRDTVEECSLRARATVTRLPLTSQPEPKPPSLPWVETRSWRVPQICGTLQFDLFCLLPEAFWWLSYFLGSPCLICLPFQASFFI